MDRFYSIGHLTWSNRFQWRSLHDIDVCHWYMTLMTKFTWHWCMSLIHDIDDEVCMTSMYNKSGFFCWVAFPLLLNESLKGRLQLHEQKERTAQNLKNNFKELVYVVLQGSLYNIFLFIITNKKLLKNKTPHVSRDLWNQKYLWTK